MKLSIRYGKIVVLIFGLFVQSSDIHAGPVISKLVDSLIESEKFIDNHAGETLFAVVSAVVFYESGKCVRKNLNVHEILAIEEQSRKDIEFCEKLEEEQWLENIDSDKEKAFNFFDEKLRKAVCAGNRNKALNYLKIVENIKISQNCDGMPELETIA